MKRKQMPRRRWSRLGRDVKALFDPMLNLQIHCIMQPLKGKNAIGSTHFPRYWITLNKEVIFDYPRQFMDLPDHKPRWWENQNKEFTTVAKSYPYEEHGVSEISNLLREYINRPKDKLFEPFATDRWGLADILRAADRRVGKRKRQEMLRTILNGGTNSTAVRKILEARFADDDMGIKEEED
jgi:hypothetical protein